MQALRNVGSDDALAFPIFLDLSHDLVDCSRQLCRSNPRVSARSVRRVMMFAVHRLAPSTFYHESDRRPMSGLPQADDAQHRLSAFNLFIPLYLRVSSDRRMRALGGN